MNREHRRDKSAAPEADINVVATGLWPVHVSTPHRGVATADLGHVVKDKKKQQHGDGVEQNVREMMADGSKSKQLAIDHVRNRRERMPVPRVAVRERPSDSAQCQPARHDRISVNVSLIVEINEFVTKRLPENQPRDCDQKQANPNDRNNLS